MYPHWIVTMQSSQNVSYSLYVNGQELMSGYVYGSKTVEFNVSGSSASVTIGLGSQVYKFPKEIFPGCEQCNDDCKGGCNKGPCNPILILSKGILQRRRLRTIIFLYWHSGDYLLWELVDLASQPDCY